MIPGTPNSLYEIGYMLKGRPSIYLNASIQAIQSTGLMMIYFIVFSETSAQLVGGFFNKALGEVWYSSKLVYVVALGLGLTPVVIKKDIAELEWLSILLGVSILIFVLLSLWLLLIDPNYITPEADKIDVTWPVMKWTTMSSVCTIMVAYSYTQNVYPIFDSLKTKTTEAY